MWCRRSHSPTTRAGALAAGRWTEPQTTGSPRTTPTWLRLSHCLWDPGWLINGRGLDAEGVGQPHEEVEERGVISRLSDLLVAPPDVAQPLHLLISHPVRPRRDRAHEIEQHPLGALQPRRVDVAVAKRVSDRPEPLVLQLQEPRMGAESITAAVQRGDVRRDHLVLSAD